jgi:hypothetical protein
LARKKLSEQRNKYADVESYKRKSSEKISADSRNKHKLRNRFIEKW